MAQKPEELEARVAELEGTLAERNEAYTKLETVANESTDQRNKWRGLIKNTFGISEITEDALKAVQVDADGAMSKTIEDLNAEKGTFTSQMDELKASHEQSMSKLVLSDTLRGLGIDTVASNDLAFEQLTQLVLADATREGASFTFKDESGITLFGLGGKPLTVKERVAELQKGDYSFLFKTQAGAGTNGQDTSNQGKAPKGGTPLTQHISKNYS